MEPLVKVQCLRHIYPDMTEVNVCGLDFVVNRGERVVVLGANGAGKTTLLFHILGLLSPVDGIVEVMGMSPVRDFHLVRRKIGAIFQNVEEQIIGPRVYDDIAFTPRNERVKREEVHRLVLEVASILGIESILYKIPHYLSGGQKKKVALAGAIVMEPEILVMDEPFHSLDPRSKKDLITFLNCLNRGKEITLIIATHDMDVVFDIADTVYVLSGGKIVDSGSPCYIFNQSHKLEKADLRLPSVVELFKRLQNKGFPVKIPQNVSEAEQQLLEIYEYGKTKVGD